ncbi:cation-transporting P-type ATPase [Streptomyces sp. KS 21]|uniref:cation-transporting P-type ATPase n=1 Tax=Streptomyces sp. KS 21 TaxID=2485150 RepID=UPI0010DE9DEA|nr:cation-transporting P-type ATPase [Streptomyces sp. KS 21]TDU79743.1 cation transport ATPase-like protein [Streptomyces sp. KS 21]
MTETAAPDLTPDTAPDPLEPLPLLRRELHTGGRGLSSREAERRLAVYGPNEVRRSARTGILRELLRQLVHPLALLLWAAPPLHNLFGTAALPLDVVLLISAFPPLVWGSDELRRWARRRHHRYS